MDESKICIEYITEPISSKGGRHRVTTFTSIGGIKAKACKWSALMDLIRLDGVGIHHLSIGDTNICRDWCESNFRKLLKVMEVSCITSLTLPVFGFHGNPRRNAQLRRGWKPFQTILLSSLKGDKITKLNRLTVDVFNCKIYDETPNIINEMDTFISKIEPYLQRNRESPHRNTITNFYTNSDESILDLLIRYKDNPNSTYQIIQAKPELCKRALVNREESNGGDNDKQPRNTKRPRRS